MCSLDLRKSIADMCFISVSVLSTETRGEMVLARLILSREGKHISAFFARYNNVRK